MGPLCSLRSIRSWRRPQAGSKDGSHGFQQASGRGSHRGGTGPYRGCHQNSALARSVPSSVTSEPLFGAERRPQSPPSIVLRFKSARSNRKLANALSRQTTQREGLNQRPRERVAAVRRAAGGLRERQEIGTRHRHRKKRDRARDARRPQAMILTPVSYTHLTLPTICSV